MKGFRAGVFKEMKLNAFLRSDRYDYLKYCTVSKTNLHYSSIFTSIYLPFLSLCFFFLTLLSISSMEDNKNTSLSIMESKPPHPLHQIAETPTHRLLLKQWHKEEELIFGRISLKETQIDSIRKEITMLYIFFFIFHSTALLLLFNASTKDVHGEACKRSWIPSLCSLLFSLGIIWAVRYKTDVEAHLEKLLEREKEDRNLLSKCVDELKRKGIEFDLLKEVDALRRAKSLRVEAKPVRKWSARDFTTLFFFSVSCIILGITRIVLCN